MPWFYYFGRALIHLVTRLFTRLRVTGIENIPQRGPVLIVSNHLSLADPPIIGISVPRQMMFMAKKELFSPGFIGYFVRSFGAFPVDRGTLDRKAFRLACEVLASGRVLMMFPEGGRSKTGKLGRGFPGSARLALCHSVPIIPVGISGTEKIQGLDWLWHRPEIKVNIGRPFYVNVANGKLTREEQEKLTDDIMSQIALLLPNEYVGDYRRQTA